MYVNVKKNLIKVVPREQNGRMTELHQVLSFDVDKLDQASKHTYGIDT
jgi:hypothetical protein